MPAPPPIAVLLHGAARVRLADGSEVPLERKQAAVLAWLAVHGPTPRSRLAGLLWPDVAEERARGNLRQRLSKLRQSAGALVDDERGLLRLAAQLQVEPAPPGSAWLDAFAFDDCSDFAAWLDDERQARRAALRQVLLAAVRAAAQQGALDDALAQADRLMAVDRESEEAYRALMEVLYLRGDRAAAIAVWDRCREMLRTLYGVAPSSITQRLGQTIVETSSAAPASSVAAIPVTVLRPPRLIGRAGLVEAMTAAWRVGNAVCVSGEGGVGKSRLLAEFAAVAGPCAIAAARPGDAVLPFASLSRLALATLDRVEPVLDAGVSAGCARLLPQIAFRFGVPDPEPLRTAHERLAAIGAFARFLEASVAAGCAAFVFDDLQFADASSIESLQALVERDSGPGEVGPARLVFGSRAEEEGPAAAGLLASLAAARRLVRLELAPLDEAGVQELMRSLGLPGFDADRQATRLRRRVGGNPAYLLESVKLIAALGQLGDVDAVLPVPPGIEAVVERRLALLSPAARHIAELAAVAGESYGVELATRALGLSLVELREPLRELEWRQVMYGRVFVHDLVASAVRQSVPVAIGEVLHRLVAGHLDSTHGEPATAAWHWREAGEWQRAGDAFREAARRSRRAAQPAAQARHLDAAATCYGRCGAQAARFAVLCEREHVTAAPDYTGTRVAQIERLELEAATEEQRLHALAARVSLHADHTLSDTLELGEEGLRRSIVLGLDALAFDFAHPVAWQLALRGEARRALEVIDASERWALAQPEAWKQARFHTARSGIHAFSDRLTDAIAEAERSLAILRRADDPVEMLPTLANLGLYRSWRGEFAAALAILEEARRLRDRLHGQGSSLLIDLHCGAALRDLGRHDDALAMLDAALAEFRRQTAGAADLRTDVVVAENHLAQLWLLLGDPGRAEAVMQTDTGAIDIRFRVRRTALQARVERLRGAAGGARWHETLQTAAAMPVTFHRILAEIEVARGEDDAAALSRLDALLGSPVLQERPGLRMTVLGLRAGVLDRMRRPAPAHADARAVLALAEAGILPFDADPVEVWLTTRDVLAEVDPRAARALADRAAKWLDETARHLPADAPSGHARRRAAIRATLTAAPTLSS